VEEPNVFTAYVVPALLRPRFFARASSPADWTTISHLDKLAKPTICAAIYLLLSSFIASCPVRAQYYTATVTGGFTTSAAAGSSPQPYTPIPGNYDASGDVIGNGYCSGQIKALFTWQPGQQSLPAPSVVVFQSCDAYWQTRHTPGMCDDGLHDPVVTKNSLSDITGDSTGKHYHIASPDATGNIEVDCTPTASAFEDDNAAYCLVAYGVNASPITISFTSGTTLVNGAQEALTGQRIGATLNIAGIASNLTWSTSGATGPNPIKNWDPNAPGDGNATQIIPLTSTDYSPTNVAAPFNFYDSNPDTVTVKCTGTVTFPDGTSSSFSAVSPTVAFMKPTVARWNVNTPGAYFPSGFASGLPIGPFLAQEVWDSMTVTLPPPFNQGSQGQACMTQIINADRAWYRNPASPPPPVKGFHTTPYSSAYKSLEVIGANDVVSYVINPTALDGAFPYPFGYNGITGQSVSTGYIWQVGNLGYSGDQPKQPYALNVNDGGGNQWYNSVANDSFTSWMMYQPPGNNSIWVPLQNLTWNWGGVANLQNGKSGSYWSVTQTPLLFSSAATNTSTYPSWTQTLPVGFGIQP